MLKGNILNVVGIGTEGGAVKGRAVLILASFFNTINYFSGKMPSYVSSLFPFEMLKLEKLLSKTSQKCVHSISLHSKSL